MKLATLMVLSTFLLAACAKESPPVTQRDGEPMVTGFEAEDGEMNAAMRKARGTLPDFEKRLEQPPATGKLGNHPVHIQSIDVGSDVLVKRENVSDWMAIDDGKMVGGFTLRVQRERMTP